MLVILQCNDSSDFDVLLEKARGLAQSHNAGLFLLAFAERSADTGLSWCPDCQNAYPIIMAALLQRKTSSVVLELIVERSSYKNNPSYVYRMHEKLKLQAVPQLYKLPGWHALVEMECLDYDLAKNFVN